MLMKSGTLALPKSQIEVQKKFNFAVVHLETIFVHLHTLNFIVQTKQNGLPRLFASVSSLRTASASGIYFKFRFDGIEVVKGLP